LFDPPVFQLRQRVQPPLLVTDSGLRRGRLGIRSGGANSGGQQVVRYCIEKRNTGRGKHLLSSLALVHRTSTFTATLGIGTGIRLLDFDKSLQERSSAKR
jgi:hypothetical protein